jgi:hypothetical protein
MRETESSVVKTQLAPSSSKSSMQKAGDIISRRAQTGNGIGGGTLSTRRVSPNSSFATSLVV